MNQEIERKFLVIGDFRPYVTKSIEIKQGYLNSSVQRTVRIRIADSEAYITIKGESTSNGLTRFEWEKQIELEDAAELMKLCEPGVINKTRHYIPLGTLTIEVDVFHGEHEGKIIAEIELPSENTIFNRPSWLGEEVTGNPDYYNSSISKLYKRE